GPDRNCKACLRVRIESTPQKAPQEKGRPWMQKFPGRRSLSSPELKRYFLSGRHVSIDNCNYFIDVSSVIISNKRPLTVFHWNRFGLMFLFTVNQGVRVFFSDLNKIFYFTAVLIDKCPSVTINITRRLGTAAAGWTTYDDIP